MRQLAMGYALKAALPNDPAWQDPVAGAEGALDVKEALKRTITASIEVGLRDGIMKCCPGPVHERCDNQGLDTEGAVELLLLEGWC